ncbi:restriction endonuclease subunit S [Actinobacillus vicugnae]|uniref:restriction endonuclease subunit S n=1 Tax=Actinobacillus vicugnae TaxID=2573093 RepID=UPI001240387B|nr:restriction endonuclease subunit S [Actinobacillus vicugnae]
MKLSQLAQIDTGYPFRGAVPEQLGSEILAVQMKDVSVQSGINWQHCVPTTLTAKKSPIWLQENDILLTSRGNQIYAVLVDSSVNQYQAVASPHFFVIRADNNKILPEFLAWQLNHSDCQRYFEQNMEGTITKSIRLPVVANTPITLFPMAKQQQFLGLVNSIKQQQDLMAQLIQADQQLINGIFNQLKGEVK